MAAPSASVDRAAALDVRAAPGAPEVPKSFEPRARLQLGVAALPQGAAEVDGVWWPRSLDLAFEVQPLLAALRAAGWHGRGVMYNLDAWCTSPR